MMMIRKRGQSTILMVIMLVLIFFGVILLLSGGLVVTKMYTALDQDIDIGQVNLRETNDLTFGKYHEMVLRNADWWGLSLIIGMILGLFLSSYFTRNSFPKIGIILDIFIILFIFFVSLYISSTYQVLLNSLAAAGETFLEDYVTKTSIFVLNLPIFVVIIGVIMMIIFHSSIPARTEERRIRGETFRGI